MKREKAGGGERAGKRASGRGTDPLARFGAFVYRKRWFVLGAWVVVLAVGAVLAPKANGVLKSGGVQAIGSDSEVASGIIDREFGVSALNNVAVVFRSPTLNVGDQEYRTQVEAATKRIERAKGVERVVSYYSTYGQVPGLASKDRHTTLVFVSLHGNEGESQTHVEGVRKAVEGTSLEHYVTGWSAVNHDFTKTTEEDLRRSEVLTFAVVLILLLLTFRTVVSAFLPLVLGGAAVLIATAIIYLIGRATDTSTFALNVASMIGLGLAIDFSLIVVSRFREELARRGDPEAATAVTMATAGRSIIYSGVTVLLGMLTLTLLVNLMVIRTISLGVVIVAAAALLAGVTLLPAILGVLSHRVERLRVIPKAKPKPETEGFWYRLSRAIMLRPWAWLGGALAILVVLAWPARGLALIGSTPELLPGHAESVKGSKIIDEQFGDNTLNPIQIVLKTPHRGEVMTPRFLTALDKLTNTLAADPRASNVSSLSTYMALSPRDGRYQHLKPIHDFWPAPDMSKSTPTNPVPGIHVTPYVSVWAKTVPWSPAYFGYGRFRFPSGTDRRLTVAATLQVYRVLEGRLTVTAGRPTTYWSAANFDKRYEGEKIAAGKTITLGPRDQLLVPVLTPVRLRVNGPPVELLTVVSFHVRPGTSTTGSWLDGQSPATDPFKGVPREVIAGGLGSTFPTGETHISLELGDAKPGARYPRHIHPGPELIAGQSGVLTVFSTPEMVITGANGQVEEGPYDTPSPVGPRGKAVVQGYSIHRGRNFGKVDAKTWSLRFLNANQPAFSVMALRPIAKAFVNLDSGSDTAVVNVIPRYGVYSDTQEGFVRSIRDLIVPSIPGLRGDKAYVGGTTASFMDFRHELYGRFPYVIGAVLVLTFLILMMFFQSVFLPLKAILMNVLSILATFGVLVLIFQHGWGSGLFGFDPVGAIGVITPAILFVVLFSLSTDYEVFLLSRVKEYYNETHDNEEAVARGLQHTGGIITAAGLILIGVFGSFATAGIITMKEIGLGLAIGILIDTVIVRSILVPATMRLAGDLNWAMPAWLKRIVPELREGPVGEPGVAAPGIGESVTAEDRTTG
jgi:uncharacterized membrane protein YdfJ with MMPL/SSD domain